MKLKNHSKLKLSFAEFGALLGTRMMLANNAVVDAKGKTYPIDQKTHGLNMNIACRIEGCGSISCIGGTMAQIMDMDNVEAYVFERDPREGYKEPIGKLFYPPDQYDWEKIKPSHAVKAIDNFLKSGKPGWKAILPKSFLKAV